jgi:hypothetical protein
MLLDQRSAQSAAVAASLLERLTHSLRTDIATLQAVADGLARGVFDPAEWRAITDEVANVGRQAQQRLTMAGDVMSVLAPPGEDPSEPVEESLRAELEGAAVSVTVDGVDDERAMTHIPGAGWAASARALADALTRDERLGGERAHVAVRPHPDGWAVTAGLRSAGAQPVAWTEAALGELVVAGQIAAAGGGWTSAVGGDDTLEVELVLPAAPSP